MKSYHAGAGAGLAGLAMEESDIPMPGPGEVLIRVRANSLNFREISVLRGTYPLPVKQDVVMGADGAGEVVEVGQGVTRYAVGDRVAAAMFPFWMDGPFGFDVSLQIGGSLDGMMREYAVVPETGLVRIPRHLTFEEAATLPCAAVTAWNALTGGRRLQAGDTVLTLGSGGVSLFALQLAKVMGARVIVTTSADRRAERLSALGADVVINYQRQPEWQRVVRDETGGLGAHQVVETCGGTLPKSMASVAVEGEVELVGRMDRSAAFLDIDLVFQAIARVRVVAAGSRAQFTAMNRAIEVAGLRPVIDRVFGFDEVAVAFEYYLSAHPLGKVVISH